MNNKIKNALAVENDLIEKRKIMLIREGAEELYPIPADEIAILRKEVAYMREVLESMGIVLKHTEFVDYNNNINSVKETTYKELDI